jgi:quercetin 2,3-dioxygenase
MKKLAFLRRSYERHWVGDGFPVRTIFSYDQDAAALSPFLLLDYAGPENFPPAEKRRGVGHHPHRGFETVTICYSGEVEHRDSSGGGGIIRAGDVQWMTAASGIVHEEFHGREYARRGGPFEMILGSISPRNTRERRLPTKASTMHKSRALRFHRGAEPCG